MPVFNQVPVATSLPPVAQTIKPQSQQQQITPATDQKGNVVPQPTPTPSQQLGGAPAQAKGFNNTPTKIIGGKMPNTPGRPITKGTKAANTKASCSYTTKNTKKKSKDISKVSSAELTYANLAVYIGRMAATL